MTSRPSDEFVRLYLQNQGRVYAYIATLVPNRSDAEDLLQKTSLVMWKKWGQFEPGRGFLPWARGIALNEIRNFLRKKDRFRVHLSETTVALLSASMEDETDEQGEDRIQALEQCMQSLCERQRSLVEQCYLESKGPGAMARSLGVSVDAVYMRLHRVRRALVDCIEKRMSPYAVEPGKVTS